MSELLKKGLPGNEQAERMILGSILLDGSRFSTVTGAITPEVFVLQKHRQIWGRMAEIAERGEVIDRITLANEHLKYPGEIDLVGGVSYLVSLDDGLPHVASLDSYITIVVEKHRLRKAIYTARKVVDQALSGEFSADEVCLNGQAMLADDVGGYGSSQIESVRSFVQSYPGGINLFLNPAGGNPGIPTGFDGLDEVSGGFHAGEIFVIGARPSHGKAQPLDAKLLRRDGSWTRMGDIHVGDRMASVDGSPSAVEAIYEQGERQVFKVTFRDGRSTECCLEHLWHVHHRQWNGGTRTVSTEALITLLKAKRNKGRISVGTFTGDCGNRQNLPVSPWLMGVILGDGDTSGTCVRINTKDQEMVELISAVIEPAYKLTPSNDPARCPSFRIVKSSAGRKARDGAGRNNWVTDSVRELGLAGCRSWEKFIPSIYLNGSKEQRMDLLRGLMDTDGTVGVTGEVSYCTTSPVLRDQVQTLVRSVGGICAWTSRRPNFTGSDGKKKPGREAYVLNILHPQAWTLFTLTRKAARVIGKKSSRKSRLNIVSIEPAGIKACRCIKVSHPSSLYLTDDYIITHNTAFCAAVAKNVARQNRAVAIFTAELSKEMFLHRMICEEAFVSYKAFRSGTLDDEQRRRVRAATSLVMDMPLYIDDSSGLRVADMKVKYNSILREREVSLMVTDYAQLIKAPKGQRFSTENDKFTAVGEDIKAFTKQSKTPMLLMSQLNRDSEKDKGDNRPKLSQCRGAGIWEEIAFIGACLYREYLRKRERADLENVAELLVEKNRSGPVSTINLRFLAWLMRFSNPEPPFSAPAAAAPPPVEPDGQTTIQ